jgi:hypothetical protein
VLLSTLRRAAQEHAGIVSPVEHGVDIAAVDRADFAAAEVEARIVEGHEQLRAIPVQRATSSGFTAFLDGIQRAEVKLYHGPVPLVYAYGAAVVRKRDQRRVMGPGLLQEHEAVFFPFRLLDPAQVGALGVLPEQMLDSSPRSDQPLPLFPPALYACAAQAIDRWREGIEREVAHRWCASAHDSDWLLVDGTLTISPELSARQHTAGLIKSQRTRFFDGADARTLLGLRAGERSSVFEPLTRRWTPVHSWYLRLRDPLGHDILWGLVRVEIAARRDSARLADLVSSWLLNELKPLTLPAASWDRLLYPIHDCEQFLRARAPALRG